MRFIFFYLFRLTEILYFAFSLALTAGKMIIYYNARLLAKHYWLLSRTTIVNQRIFKLFFFERNCVKLFKRIQSNSTIVTEKWRITGCLSGVEYNVSKNIIYYVS